MQLIPDKRLFWFLKDNIKLDLSDSSVLDMYIQQIITYGKAEDIKGIFKNISSAQFKESFLRLRTFVPFEVRKFWEDFLGIA